MEPPHKRSISPRTTIITSIVAILLAGTLFSVITMYQPTQPIPLQIIGSVATLSIYEAMNATEAQRIGFKGYVTQTVENHTGTIFIPATGSITVTVDLWFVSYDWNVTQTSVMVAPKISSSDELTGFEAVCEPSGEMTLTVDKPTRLNVTLRIPKYTGHGVGIGDRFHMDLVDLRSSYTILANGYSEERWTPKISVTPENVTTETMLSLSLYNPGPSSIYFGHRYHIEQMVNGTWKEVPIDAVWLAVLVVSKPGGTWHETVDLTELSFGRYRISKDIERQGMQTKLFAEFEISRPRG